MSKRTNPDFANYYVRDAQGNALATYALKNDSLYLIEQNLYGSSRLGVKNLAILAQIDTQRQQISDTLRIFEERVGAKNYELSNHLGNVLATIGDKTIFNTDHYNGIVYSAQLYYPFGWEIPTLSYAAKKYRFGFNGKEDDREWHAQDYGFRLYTPREGRFIGVDPITAEYPELTPYQFASNTPIQAVDLDGLEAWYTKPTPQGEKLEASNANYIKAADGPFSMEYAHSLGWQDGSEQVGIEISIRHGSNVDIGGKNGGHVVWDLKDGYTYGFTFLPNTKYTNSSTNKKRNWAIGKDADGVFSATGRVHIFPSEEHPTGIFSHSTAKNWYKSGLFTNFSLNISLDQFFELKDIYTPPIPVTYHYNEKAGTYPSKHRIILNDKMPDYDYSLFGQKSGKGLRCASSLVHEGTKVGIFDANQNFKKFTPGQLIKSLHKTEYTSRHIDKRVKKIHNKKAKYNEVGFKKD